MRQTKLRNILLTTNVESLTEVCKNFGAVHKLVNELHGVHTISLDYVYARDNGTTNVIETSWGNVSLNSIVNWQVIYYYNC